MRGHLDVARRALSEIAPWDNAVLSIASDERRQRAHKEAVVIATTKSAKLVEELAQKVSRRSAVLPDTVVYSLTGSFRLLQAVTGASVWCFSRYDQDERSRWKFDKGTFRAYSTASKTLTVRLPPVLCLCNTFSSSLFALLYRWTTSPAASSTSSATSMWPTTFSSRTTSPQFSRRRNGPNGATYLRFELSKRDEFSFGGGVVRISQAKVMQQ